MKLYKILFTVIVACCLLPYDNSYSGDSDAVIKCWINKDNIKECGTYVPPEYAHKGYEKINSWGISEKVNSIKTEAELAEIAAKDKEAHEIELKKRRDKTLLNTFTKVSEIEASMNEKIAIINSNLGLIKKRNIKFKSELDIVKKRISILEKENKPVAQALIDNVASLEEKIISSEKSIMRQNDKEEQIRQEHLNYIIRFKELTLN